MDLSSELISQFVKITKDDKNIKNESTLYGTIVVTGGSNYVKLDGSELLTPISKTTDIKSGERVMVLLKDHTAIVTGNLSSPAARTDRVEEINNEVGALKVVVADKVSTKDLEANYATIKSLDATNATISNLDADVSKINKLIFGSATGTIIQTEFANAVIAQLGDAQIKSAMIDSISAGKITSGSINTNSVNISSDDEKLLISKGTIQIKDSTRVRVQIGKDASNDYSINVWDNAGKLMFSSSGITEDAIKSAIIRDDMVSTTANISASKLDIDSLFESINDNTTKTIKSTKVYLDDKKQTLDVVFKSMTNDLDGLSGKVSSQGTSISAIQGQITSKIWQQDIDTSMGSMSTRVSIVEQTVNGLTVRLDEMQIGGRNLIANTSTSEISLGGFPSSGYSEGKSGTTINIPDKDEYVLSFEAKSTVSGDVIRCHFYSPNTTTKIITSTGYSGTSADGLALVTLTDSWKRYWVKYTQNGENTTSVKSWIVGRRTAGSGTGSISVRSIKLEEGHTPSSWSQAPEDVANSILDASRKATNYFNFDSNGLIIGNLTAETLGNNVLIDSNGIDIRNGTTVLASFEDDSISLGRYSENSTINLCGGKGIIKISDYGTGTEYFRMDSTGDFKIFSDEQLWLAGSGSTKYFGQGYPWLDLSRGIDDSGNSTTPYATLGCLVPSKGVSNLTIGISLSQLSSYGLLRFDSDTSSIDMNATNGYIRAHGKNFGLTESGLELTGNLYVNGRQYAINKVLWSGASFMNASQTCTLSESITSQPNGIILVWSAYSGGASKNYQFQYFFIPKYHISAHAGCGISVFLTSGGATNVTPKYVYINDTTITGNDDNAANNSTSSSGITIKPKTFVLRYVIGV